MTKSLHQLIQDEFGIKVYVQTNVLVTQIETAITKVIPNNPNRLGFIFMNLGATSIYLAPHTDPSATNGIFLGASGGTLTLKWDEDFDLVGYSWYGIAIAVASECYSLEVISGGG